jgi:redox-sensitive bicupin YhaK (pirin superfamily)
MYAIRHSDQRGRANFGWLDSRHTFSFGHYHDQKHMGFGALRVINEDRVKPGKGFDTHGRRDMEILSYVIEGALLHKDSMGNGSIIRPGDLQRMSAGTGVRHSEYNASGDEDVHFLQIWIVPEVDGLPPGYEQQAFTREDKLNQLRLVGSRDGRVGSIVIHRDVDLFASVLEPGATVSHPLGETRRGWIQVVRGSVELDGQPLTAGDGVAISQAGDIALTGVDPAEVLLFDMG